MLKEYDPSQAEDNPVPIGIDTVGVLMPHFTHARTSRNDSLIPKKIFQTWKSRYVSPAIYQHLQQVIANNPDYDYYFFGDDECRAYLSQYYSLEYLQAFDDLIPGAFKADFWRYAILAREGGVYIDVDLVLTKPLSTIIPRDASFVSVKDRSSFSSKTAIYQAFIACTPYHPFMNVTLSETLYNVQTHYFGESCLGITGPITMGNAMAKYLMADSFIAGEYSGEGIGKWVLFDFPDRMIFSTGGVIADKQDGIVFQHKLSGYESLDNYGALFHSKKVYKSYERTFLDKYFPVFINVLILIVLIMILMNMGHYYTNKRKK